jgi:hypothetical protein
MEANEGITDADLQVLLRENVLAAEQLRRIVSERLQGELKEELRVLRDNELQATVNTKGGKK